MKKILAPIAHIAMLLFANHTGTIKPEPGTKPETKYDHVKDLVKELEESGVGEDIADVLIDLLTDKTKISADIEKLKTDLLVAVDEKIKAAIAASKAA